MAFTKRLKTDKDSAFTVALTTGQGTRYNLTGLESSKIRIKHVGLTSRQNLAWDVIFFGTDGYNNTSFDTDTYQSKVCFTGSDGATLDAAGTPCYYSSLKTYPGMDLPYEDRDETKELHIFLANRSGTAKGATGNGRVTVEVLYEEERGY